MKQGFHYVAMSYLIIFLIFTSQTSTRFLAPKQGKEPRMNELAIPGSTIEVEENLLPVNELMGVENCKSEDEECMKRRIMAEAHLDYIYTQNHKP